MANLRVFVSSTCYDLSVIRGQLRQFIIALGHDPVLSEFNDVLYDPSSHTVTSCVREIGGVDAVILVIGSRFGGLAAPEALKTLDFAALAEKSRSKDFLKDPDKLSITQIEILKAIESAIPVFVFVDERVLNDHSTYERNKHKSIASEIEYSSIDRPDTARYIFEFINFLRQRGTNNAVFSFSRLQDIEDALRKQWSALLQRLLLENRSKQTEGRRIDALTNQLEDLKAAILSAVGGSQDQKDIARGVVRFRRLLDFIKGFEPRSFDFLWGNSINWTEVLVHLGVESTVPSFNTTISTNFGPQRDPTFYVKDDQTFYSVDRILDGRDIEKEWNAFISFGPETRRIIAETLLEMRVGGIPKRLIVHHPMTIEEYMARPESEVRPTSSDDDTWARISTQSESTPPK